MSEEDKERKLKINLNNDVLISNCGVPLCIVVNKTDISNPQFEDKTDFILKHIRKTAINYGSTVIYTSTKKNNNINVLYDYLLYSLLNYDLLHKSNFMDKSSFFIPSGYDRFSVLKNNDTQNDLDSLYSDKIKLEDKQEEDVDILKEEITCDKLSDFLQQLREGKLKSRKSIMRDEIKFGKYMADEEKDNKQNLASSVLEGSKEDKINKFKEKFDSKRASKTFVEPIVEKTKEEKKKNTKELILSKLGIKKK